MTKTPARGLAWSVFAGIIAGSVACSSGGGDSAESDSDSFTRDSSVYLDTAGPVAEPDVQLLCPGGCSAFDGPCTRGLCGAFGCEQIRDSGNLCDDGLDCTSGDRCERGMCRGEMSTCGPGVTCGGVFCPGATARCDGEGHCVACSKVLVDAECENPQFPYLACPNMPGGKRVVARLTGRVPTTGPVYYIHIGLSWADSTWGDTASGFCDLVDEHEDGLPFACALRFSGEWLNFSPNIRQERLTFVDGTVAAFVVASSAAPFREERPVCDEIRLGGAVLSIEVEP